VNAQEEAPSGLKEPARQAVQFEAPLRLYVPEGQGAGAAAPAGQ
jgi:hypothetical protein